MKAGTRSPPKRKGLGPERREEILDAALRLFSQYGLYGVSTRQIASAVGISQPTLYAYFPSKHDLAAALHERAFAGLHARLVASLALPRTRDGFRVALRHYVDFGLDNPDAYRLAFMLEGPLGRTPRADDLAIPPEAHATFGVLRIWIDELHANGSASSDDPERLAQSLWAALHGLVALLLARPEFPWVEREALIQGHIDLLLDAAVTGKHRGA
ncbi:MAG: TetR/AcrR family transcriptional regulator [Phenylobacterium sp.]|uniref:TetR/AcrR family transcriptional regulator n=1 Tax=Phenylobacterium sp. TaxID=1871053 RepID=UPI00120C78AB|nr:TetR/AcrR family transcriptional regulator [Phenylobacterium sp.]TAL28406.1 MAG: TetR/AcrR family transcriptional regulator [Phenylobacterium sp.]